VVVFFVSHTVTDLTKLLNLSDRSKETIISLYKTLVRPHLMDLMRLEIRRVGSDLIEIFKIVNGKFILIVTYFFSLIRRW